MIKDGVLTISGPVQHKRGTSSALSASEYVPAAGEIVVATDTGDMRAGDGVRKWSELPSLNARLSQLEEIRVIDCGEIATD